MTRNKGGRPTERGEAKSAAVAVRTTPTLKAVLQAAADDAGRSLTQEIERRLELSLAADKVRRSVETEALLNEIAREIDTIEEQRGTRWHRDLATWAAVSEAMKSGPIERARPDKLADNPAVMTVWRDLQSIRQLKKAKLQLLAVVGITAPELPTHLSLPPLFRRRGMFGAAPRYDGAVNALLGHLHNGPPRELERRSVEALDVPDEARAMLLSAVEEIAELDKMELEAAKRFDEAVAPFDAATDEGRKWYRDYADRQRALIERDQSGA